jgi:predicted metal-dependent RNase
MKIRTDSVPLQNRSYQNIKKSSIPDITTSAQPMKNVQQTQNIKLNIAKALTEALNIAQISSNIAVKAQIAVSSLRNTAPADQMITNVITEYKTAAPEIAAKKQFFTDNNIKEIPQLSEDINRLVEFRNKPAPHQSDEINYIDTSLKSKIESIQNSIDQIEKKIANLYPVNSKRNTSFYTELLTHTALMIVKNANTALAMQGNISRESINRLNAV